MGCIPKKVIYSQFQNINNIADSRLKNHKIVVFIETFTA